MGIDHNSIKGWFCGCRSVFDFILQGNAETSFVAVVFLSSRDMQEIFNMIVKEMTVLLLLWYWELTYRSSFVIVWQWQIFSMNYLHRSFIQGLTVALKYFLMVTTWISMKRYRWKVFLICCSIKQHCMKKKRGKVRNVEGRREGEKRDREVSVIQAASLISLGSSSYFCALRDSPKKHKVISFIIIKSWRKSSVCEYQLMLLYTDHKI